ncbi:AAA family ATPase [Halochromatium salexigens]|uniref:Rad50/SbcC-type AAA domain-containing protein n=1 Tax=Halochromatium salexigens TaxID=49447 RepID=A0AAJ0UEV1_HALSE|nr:AAA family ATPase [Halochromatium salexigens]MBK5930147.1 hypothetical protein [Halochromatium salexigens]
MQLKRLRVAQLRRFQQPLELADLAPGINLITGPNESGKSTLVRAIRAAFFERHRSSSVTDLQPHGDSSAAPEVELEFCWQDQAWHLNKRFLARKRCDLRIDRLASAASTEASEALNGDEAEERLAELLGFSHPGRGASKAEHWGIPGLLWIEQGAGHELREAVAHAGNHLHSALGGELGELGEVASSSGDAILQAVDTQKKALLTATGRPHGDYKTQQQALEEQRRELTELDARITAYRDQVDRLATLRQQHAEDQRDKPWEALRAQQHAAQAQLDQVEQLQQVQRHDEQQRGPLQRQLDLLRDQLDGFEQQRKTLEQRQVAEQKARDQLAALSAREPALAEALAQAQAAYQAARARLQQAQRQQRRDSLQQTLAQLAQQLKALDHSLTQARKVQAELLEQRQQLQRDQIDPHLLEELRHAEQARSELEIRRQGIATRVRFELRPGQQLTLGNTTLADSGEELLLEPAELLIPETGRLQIIPGGEDLSALAREHQRLSERISALRAQLKVADLIEAEARAASEQTLTAKIQANQALLSSLAPEGIELLAQQQQALRQQQATLGAELEATSESLTKKPADHTRSATPNQALDADSALDPNQAEAQLETAHQALDLAEKAQKDHQLALTTAQSEARSSANERQRLQAELEAPERQTQLHSLNQALTDALAEQQILAQRIEARQQQIEAARPEILKQDVGRFASSAEQSESAARARELELNRLESHLEALSAEGLEEQRAECQLACEQLERAVHELERRAKALSLLQTLLRQQRQALTQRLQAPLQTHINRYLSLLFPHAGLSVDEQLIPHQITRTGNAGTEHELIDSLSFGAREQLGLISRFAYADLLQQAGQPTLIILDDALVHSDSHRLAQMKRILFDAAQRHQVLLFTCHPEHWRDLGAAPRELFSESSL